MGKEFFHWKGIGAFLLLLLAGFSSPANKRPAGCLTVRRLIEPVLTAASGATVDTAFTVTFTDDAIWRSAITSITIRNSLLVNPVDATLPASAYVITAGQITFLPAASALLQSAGIRDIKVYATGYITAEFSQNIGVGADNRLFITTQPAAPAINGSVLSVQPVVLIQDQYGNTTTSTLKVVASVGNGTWNLGGTTARSAVNGSAAFTNLTAGDTTAVGGAIIIFSADGVTGVTSGTFNIPPLYDVCSGALTIPWDGSVSADNTYATDEVSGSPCTTSSYGLVKGIWFKVTSPVSGPVTISTCGSASMDTYLRVYTGSCTSFTTCAGSNDDNAACLSNPTSSAASFTATANTTYYVLCGIFTSGKKGGIITISAFSTFTPPVLTASSGATVDTAFTVTFPDDGNWRNAITNVVYQNTLLTPGIDYTITPGTITLYPDGTAGGILGKSGNYLLTVEATGYSNATVIQSVLHGIPALITVSTQPTGPAASGGTLTRQPAVTVTDRYGNLPGSGFMVTAAVTPGQDSSWSLAGTLSAVTISNSIANFSGLTATNKTGITYQSATLTFTVGTTSATSAVFTIPPHPATIPTVTTLPASSIGPTTASSGGEVISDGYAPVSARGAVWNSRPAPTIALVSKTADGTGTGTFVSFFSPLIANTRYYYRSYATNRMGTAYGTENNLTTLPATPVIMPAVSLSLNGFTAQWNKPVQGSDLPVTYEMQISINPVDFSNPVAAFTGIAETADPQQYPVDSGLNGGIPYYYRTRSVTDAGYSSWSQVSDSVDLPVLTFTASDRDEQVMPGSLAVNDTNSILSHTQLVVTNGTGILSGVTCITPGADSSCNYTDSDISGFKLWYSTSNDFNSKIQIGNTFNSGKTDQASPETILFPLLALTLPVNTYYFWITGNVSDSATVGRTITVNAPVYTVTAGAVNNECHSSGTQTIAAGEPGTPLPLSLTSFSALQQTGVILITWSVTGEDGVLSYGVEHSINGVDFGEIGSVNAGNTGSSQSYNWVDGHPADGINYYRLKMVSAPDKIQYSQVVKITDHMDGKRGILIYPNPVSNHVAVLQLDNLPAGVYTLYLYNSAGSLLKRQIIHHPEGNECLTVQLPAGITAGDICSVTVRDTNGTPYSEKMMVL